MCRPLGLELSLTAFRGLTASAVTVSASRLQVIPLGSGRRPKQRLPLASANGVQYETKEGRRLTHFSTAMLPKPHRIAVPTQPPHIGFADSTSFYGSGFDLIRPKRIAVRLSSGESELSQTANHCPDLSSINVG